MKKKLFTVLLCICITATLFGGCGSLNDEGNNIASTESSALIEDTVTNETQAEETIIETETVEVAEDYFTITLNGTKLNFQTSSASDYINACDGIITANEYSDGQGGSLGSSYRNIRGQYKGETLEMFTFYQMESFTRNDFSKWVTLYGDVALTNTYSEIRAVWGEPDYFYDNVAPLGHRVIYDYYLSEDGIYVACINYVDQGVLRGEEPLENADLLPVVSICYAYNEKGLELFESKLIDGTTNQIDEYYDFIYL